MYGFSYAFVTTPKNGMTDVGSFMFRELLWADNNLGVEGAKQLAKALESNRTLTTLNLLGTSRRYNKKM
jgi:hypothetical protein